METRPDKILEITEAFQASKHLYAAEHVGLFEALADGPSTIDTLAAAVDVPVERLRVVADAMVALELIERDGEAYRNSEQAQAFLTGHGPADLRPAIRYRDAVSYEMWDRFPEVVAGEDVEPREFDDDELELFSNAMVAFTGGMAAKLARSYGFDKHERVLDIGGGKGRWLTAILDAHPHLKGTLFELPDVAEIARRELPSPMADRIDVVGGDALEEALPEGHDVVLVANVLHQFPPETNEELLGRIRKAVDPGTRILLADTWTDPTGTEPLPAALLSGEFLVFSGGEARGYREDEARAWLEATGWRCLEREHIEGPGSVVIAEAT